jgi:hypothetical protein
VQLRKELSQLLAAGIVRVDHQNLLTVVVRWQLLLGIRRWGGRNW